MSGILAIDLVNIVVLESIVESGSPTRSALPHSHLPGTLLCHDPLLPDLKFSPLPLLRAAFCNSLHLISLHPLPSLALSFLRSFPKLAYTHCPLPSAGSPSLILLRSRPSAASRFVLSPFTTSLTRNTGGTLNSAPASSAPLSWFQPPLPHRAFFSPPTRVKWMWGKTPCLPNCSR
jgi:hypothetical protein